MALAKCIFCGTEQDDYQGTYLIKNDGTTNYYCSRKCFKNHLKLGRDRRKLKWTAAFYESRDKRYAAEKKAHDKKEAAHKAEHEHVPAKSKKQTKN